jgi:hypothetical protein
MHRQRPDRPGKAARHLCDHHEENQRGGELARLAKTFKMQLLEEVSLVENLFHVNRPGMDWATFAGMVAAESILQGCRTGFDRRTDPSTVGLRHASTGGLARPRPSYRSRQHSHHVQIGSWSTSDRSTSRIPARPAACRRNGRRSRGRRTPLPSPTDQLVMRGGRVLAFVEPPSGLMASGA